MLLRFMGAVLMACHCLMRDYEDIMYRILVHVTAQLGAQSGAGERIADISTVRARKRACGTHQQPLSGVPRVILIPCCGCLCCARSSHSSFSQESRGIPPPVR